MRYDKAEPSEALKSIINCYWLIDSEGNRSIHRQKIVPDGYPEIIIHYGDPYRINLEGTWQRQERQLLAGQIRKHFFLENTGASGILGIKLQPTATRYFCDIDMQTITGRVVSMPRAISQLLSSLRLNEGVKASEIFNELDQRLSEYINQLKIGSIEADKAIALIIARKGNIDIAELLELTGTGQRKLERQFQRHVGLSPKFYSRIVRLGHIFELMQQGDKTWSDLVYDSGFYDQSHFIKNFKEFTGEDPSAYGFEEKNMANFHLRK